MNHRLLKIASLMQQEISRIILYDLADPRLGFITITEVKPAPDLKTARVYISVLGGDAQLKITLDGLRHARGYIQELLSKRAILRFTPRLTFEQDSGVQGAARIQKLIGETQEKHPD